jgi:hypothetical protein
MSPQLQAWKAQMNRLPENKAAFEKWLFVHIAGVLFADKAGELLTLRAGQFQLSIDEQIRRIETLSPAWKYSQRVLCRIASCARVVLYDPGKVRDALLEVPQWVFDGMGYPLGIGPAEFLEEVGRRWRQKGQIPHEIGLALGYPVKDVLGYMGLVPLPCTGGCGWRIHGNPATSLRRSREFSEAKEKALAFLSKSREQERPRRTLSSVSAPCMAPF